MEKIGLGMLLLVVGLLSSMTEITNPLSGGITAGVLLFVGGVGYYFARPLLKSWEEKISVEDENLEAENNHNRVMSEDRIIYLYPRK
jgi:hypothetical protein